MCKQGNKAFLTVAVNLLVTCLVCLCPFFALSVQADEDNYSRNSRRTHILFVCSYSLSDRWTSEIFDSFSKDFDTAATNYDVSLIELSALQNSSESALWDEHFTAIEGKLAGSYYSLIIALDDPAANLLLHNRAKISLSTPLLVCGRQASAESANAQLDNVTGIFQPYDVSGTCDLIIKLKPRLREVYLVCSDNVGVAPYRAELERHFVGFDKQLMVKVISSDDDDLSVLAKTRNAPEETAVVLLPLRDKAHSLYYQVSRSCYSLVEICGQPFFSVTDEFFGLGTVGGSVVNGSRIGNLLSSMACEVIAKGTANGVSFCSPEFEKIIDYELAKDSKLLLHDLPENVTIINQPPIFYAKNYRNLLLLAVVCLLVLSLVGAFMFTTYRTQSAMVKFYRVLPLCVGVFDKNGQMYFYNPSSLGCRVEETDNQPDSLYQQLFKNFQLASNDGISRSFEFSNGVQHFNFAVIPKGPTYANRCVWYGFDNSKVYSEKIELERLTAQYNNLRFEDETLNKIQALLLASQGLGYAYIKDEPNNEIISADSTFLELLDKSHTHVASDVAKLSIFALAPEEMLGRLFDISRQRGAEMASYSGIWKQYKDDKLDYCLQSYVRRNSYAMQNRIVILLGDHTAQELQRLAREHTENYWRAALDALPIHIFIKNYDEDGKFIFVNKDFSRSFGIPNSEAIGRTRQQLFGDNSQVKQVLDTNEPELFKGLERQYFNYSVELGNANWKLVKASWSCKDGRHLIVGAAFDVTDLVYRRKFNELYRKRVSCLLETNHLRDEVPAALAEFAVFFRSSFAGVAKVIKNDSFGTPLSFVHTWTDGSGLEEKYKIPQELTPLCRRFSKPLEQGEAVNVQIKSNSSQWRTILEDNLSVEGCILVLLPIVCQDKLQAIVLLARKMEDALRQHFFNANSVFMQAVIDYYRSLIQRSNFLAEVKLQRHQFSVLFDTAPWPVWVSNEANVIHYLNEAAEAFCVLDARGMHPPVLWQDNDKPYEVTVAKDSKHYKIHIEPVMMQTAEGGRRVCFGFVDDFMQFDEIVNLAKQRKQQFFEFAQSLPVAVLVTDVNNDNRPIFSNTYYDNLLDLIRESDGSMVNLNVSESGWLLPNISNTLAEVPLDDSVLQTQPFRMMTIPSKKGRSYLYGRELDFKSGNIHYHLYTYQDVTSWTLDFRSASLIKSSIKFLTGKEREQAVYNMLQELISVLLADRGFLYIYDDATKTFTPSVECLPNKSLVSLVNPKQYFKLRNDAWSLHLMEGNAFCMDSFNSLPREQYGGICNMLQRFGARGFFVQGFFRDGNLEGLWGISYETSSIVFTARAKALLQDISAVLGFVAEHQYNTAQLKKTYDTAVQSNLTKSRFIASVSHEIRTPLNAIVGFSSLMLSCSFPEEDRNKWMKAIYNAGNSLNLLVDDIVDISKMDVVDKIAYAPVDILQLCNNVVDIFAYDAEIRHLSLDADYDPVPVLITSEQRIRQLLFNLVGNAMKYTRQGGVVLKVLFQAKDAHLGRLTIQVIDTGVGISEADQKKLFKEYSQVGELADAGLSTSGTGLGLSISKRLVAQMGGKITLESELNRGSCFSVVFENIEYTEQMSQAVVSEKPNEVKNMDEKLILLVDDVPVNLLLLEAELRSLGAKTVSACSAMVALEKLKENKISLILSDLWMQDVNGSEFAKKVRELPGYEDIKIVAITADTGPDENFDMSLFNDVLFKPISVGKLKPLVDQLAQQA